jgi:hypothetical protein
MVSMVNLQYLVLITHGRKFVTHCSCSVCIRLSNTHFDWPLEAGTGSETLFTLSVSQYRHQSKLGTAIKA